MQGHEKLIREADKHTEGARGKITCKVGAEAKTLNLLGNDDPDPNVWMQNLQPEGREVGCPRVAEVQPGGGLEERMEGYKEASSRFLQVSYSRYQSSG